MNVSVLVPVFRNAKSLRPLAEHFSEMEKKFKKDFNFEYIFIDDGSDDGSYDVLNDIHTTDVLRKMILIKLTRNFGQMAALYAGMAQSSGDAVAVISADLQDNPGLIPKMLHHFSKETPLVIAERKQRDDSVLNKLTSRLYYKFVRKFAIPNYPKSGFDCCLFSRKIANELVQLDHNSSHIFVNLMWMGYPYETVFYDRVERVGGVSQWSFFKRIKLFLDVMVGFSYAPIRFASSIGALISLISIVYGVSVVGYSLWMGLGVPGWSTLVILTTFLGGISILILGILGEYLWRTLEAVKKRPIYFVEKTSVKSFQNFENEVEG